MKIARFDQYGSLYFVYPRNKGVSLYESRDVAYQADIFVIQGKEYHLDNVIDVANIPIPNFDHAENVTGDLSYIAKIRLGIVEDQALVPIFVDKVLELMLHSKVGWRMGDYLQVIRAYYRVGLFDEGDEYERLFRIRHPEIFEDLGKADYEIDNNRTKAYFKRKWIKKHPDDL